jgi:AraC-like DNA-binding protein/mannose-6-phosphate isomerase-like protein (cupin superfamily)
MKQRDQPVAVTMPSCGVAAFSSHHSRRFVMPWMSHPYDKICVIEAGAGQLAVKDRAMDLTAGQIVRISPGMLHRFVDSPGDPLVLSAICIRRSNEMQTKWFRPVWAQLESALPPCEPRGPLSRYSLEVLGDIVRQVLRESTTALAGAESIIQAFASQFAVNVLRALRSDRSNASHRPLDDIDAAIAWVDDHFTEPIKLPQLAHSIGISYRSLTSLFKARTGMTVVQYILRRRVDFARRRILDTAAIAPSAYEAGFNDLTHFYRVFSALQGTTPGKLLRNRCNDVDMR